MAGLTKEQREAKEAKIKEELLKAETKKDITETKKKNITIESLPSYTNVRVKSNCFGQLIYVSTKTQNKIEWDNTSTPQYLSLEELLIMRNSQRKFFENAWVAIDGFVDSEYSELFSIEDILNYLQVKQFYKDALCPENIDNLFTMSPDDIAKRISNSSSNSKDFIIIRANELIREGKLDSLKVITALEKSLNCELDKTTIE